MRNINSYQGWYNENYLRSSYEYVYAKICEVDDVDYRVEEKLYEFEDGTTYKPDFHIYNNNVLLKIVEIKSEKKESIKEAILKKDKMIAEYGLAVEIYCYDDLKRLCIQYDLDINQLIREWKTMDGISKNNILTGELNPMYGRHHSEQSKKKIGLKTTERFKDSSFRKKYNIAHKKSMASVDKSKYKQRASKIIRQCEYCGKDFMLYDTVNNRKIKTCSINCKSLLGNKKVAKSKRKNAIAKYTLAKEDVLEIAKSNKDIIFTIPYNNIRPMFEKLFKDILQKHNLKDIRVLFYIFYQKYNGSFKQLLDDIRVLI